MPSLDAAPTTLRGLDDDAVLRRRSTLGPNVLPRAPRPRVWRRLARELREPMAVLLLLAAVVSGVALDEPVDAVAILVIVVLNISIALVQEGKAHRALDALRAYDPEEATVVRGGIRRRVAVEDLVPDDVVLVTAGDRVPADVTLLHADALEVDESLLTGESLPVRKRAGAASGTDVAVADRVGGLLRGTMVVRGGGVGVVASTGARTAMGTIASDLGRGDLEPTPLQVQLGRLTGWLGTAALLVAGSTFLLIVATGSVDAVADAFLPAVALAVAAVPEGLAAVTTVALALGVSRMAGRGAIVRRLSAVETLGATDVLVVDKTGTITENRMEVVRVHTFVGPPTAPDLLPDTTAEATWEVLALCNDSTVDPPTGDPMEQGLLRAVPPDVARDLVERRPRVATAPFSAERLRMSTLHRDDAGYVLLTKGAPEAVVALCTRAANGMVLTAQRRDAVAREIEQAAAAGERMLALASRRLDDVPADVEAAETDLTLLGVAALRDPPRRSASASIEAAASAGLRLIMATGDHPTTAEAIAREVGLIDAVGTVLTGADVTGDGLPDDPSSVSVYARVDPAQKLALVRRLRATGHTVAMTGDGVNDAPALRHADIGVALGASGSDVAREAADLVVTDDDLATIVEAVREGRGIYDNLRKVVDYLVCSNLSEVVVVVAGLLAFPELGLPLLPLQLLWINLMTDGLPALALGADPVDADVMRRPPRRSGEAILSPRRLAGLLGMGSVLAAGAIGALAVSTLVLELSDAQIRTVVFNALVLAQVVFAFVIHRGRSTSRPVRNPWLRWAALAALLLQAVVVTWEPARNVFDTAPLPAAAWAVVLVAGLSGPAVVAARAAGRPGHRREPSGP